MEQLLLAVKFLNISVAKPAQQFSQAMQILDHHYSFL